MSPEGVKAMHDQIQALQSQLQEARDELELLRNQKVELAAARAIVERQYNTIIKLTDKWDASEAEVARSQGELSRQKDKVKNYRLDAFKTPNFEAEIAKLKATAFQAQEMAKEICDKLKLRERQLDVAKDTLNKIMSGLTTKQSDVESMTKCLSHQTLIEIEALKLEANEDKK